MKHVIKYLMEIQVQNIDFTSNCLSLALNILSWKRE